MLSEAVVACLQAIPELPLDGGLKDFNMDLPAIVKLSPDTHSSMWGNQQLSKCMDAFLTDFKGATVQIPRAEQGLTPDAVKVVHDVLKDKVNAKFHGMWHARTRTTKMLLINP